MGLISDILLIAGAFGAAFYCFVLSRRLKRFNDLEKGMGGAVAVLSAQVDDLEKSVERAKTLANTSQEDLMDVTSRAEDVRRQLELQIASLHDVVPAEPAHTAPAPRPEEVAAVSEEPMFVRHRTARGAH